MIKQHIEPNGWYGDATLEGDYVSLHRDSHISVNGLRLELPVGQYGKENVLFLVCLKFQGQILIAGQGQIGDNGSGNWLYKDGEWKIVSGSFATFSCAFSSTFLYLVCGNNQYIIYDLLTDSLSAPINRQIGSNGIRYIDFAQSPDGIVTGDSTYGPQPYNISQWTQKSDIVIGQSYIDGCVALYGQYYKLEPGDTQFIRFKRDNNNQICISIVKMLENSTVFYWMDVADIKQFPVEGYNKPFPLINGTKGPVHQMQMELQAPNLIETVKRMMRIHTEINLLDDDERGILLDWVIKAEGRSQLGRKAKNKDGSNKNTDALTWLRTDGKFEIYDVISGSDGSATWDLGTSPTNSSGIWSPGENGYWTPGNPVGINQPDIPPISNPNVPIIKIKSEAEVREVFHKLLEFYNNPEGLNRHERGIESPIEINDEAFLNWITLALVEDVDKVIEQIKTFPEYKEQHP